MKKIIVALVLIIALISTSTSAMAAEHNTTVSCIRDKFMDNSGPYTSWPFGDRAALYVGHYSSFGISTSALCFHLSSLPSDIVSIKLRLPIWYVQGDALLELYGQDDDTWSEDGPDMPAGTTLLHTEVLPADNSGATQWKEIDVTAYVQGQYSRDRYATFVVKGNTSGDTNFSFYAREDSYERPELVITHTSPSCTQSAATPLTENNMESVNVTLTLENTTFADSSLNLSNFVSSNPNASVASVTYNSATSATLRLQNNLADFDSSYTYTVTVNGSELSSGAPIVSNALTVTAVNDSESISAELDADGITQSFEDGEVISVTLTGGVFSPVLNPTNWSLSNFRSGVSIASVNRIDDTHAAITLSGNASDGGTADINNAKVSCNGNEYSDGSATLTSGNLTIYVHDDDAPYITVNETPTIDRGASVTMTTAILSATDPDSDDSTIEFTVTSPLSHGQMEYIANPGVAISSFTQQDLLDSTVQYVHDNSNTISDSMTFKVSDGTNELTGQVFSIDINPTAVEDIQFDSNDETMDIGDTRTIGHTFTPSDPYNTTVTYSSDNITVATVDASGAITANAVGVAHITITSDDTTNGTISDTLTVEVIDPTPEDSDAFKGKIKGTLLDSTGTPMAGYTVTLYSSPIYAVTGADGSFSFGSVPYDHHTFIVSDSSGSEIGRFSLNFAVGVNTAQSVDNALNIADITYISRTEIVDLSVEANGALDDIDISDIDFTNSPAVNPRTGDSTMSIRWFIILGAAALLLIGAYVFKKQRVNE